MKYNRKIEEVSKAMKQIYINFALEYGKIQKLDLAETEKQNLITQLINRTTNSEILLRETRDLSEISDEDKENLGITEIKTVSVDPKVVDTLVSIFARKAKMPSHYGTNVTEQIKLKEGETLKEIDTTAFEEELRQFFTEHYQDLINDGYNSFIADITEVDNGLTSHQNGELAQIAMRHNIDPDTFSCFGYQLTVQDGLVAEEDSTLGKLNVFYATPEAINKRIYELYGKSLFKEKQEGKKDTLNEQGRKLKNKYISYAEKNGIEIQDKDALEEIPVDMKKVNALALYINRKLHEKCHTTQDMTQELADEIQRDYSKIMNLTYYQFDDLETVKKAIKDSGQDILMLDLGLSIGEDSIIDNSFTPDIAYATPEYLRREYSLLMSQIRALSLTDAFLDNKGYKIKELNDKKDALRRYIAENGIDIDISVPEVEVDHEKTRIIADGILNQYGNDYVDKEGMRARILEKIEARYPELISERQVIDINELLRDELEEMGKIYVSEDLYVQNDFIYMGDITGINSKCLYATPESLKYRISNLDEKIISDMSNFNKDKLRIRKELERYAKDNNFDIEIPNIESVERKRRQENERFTFRGTETSLWESFFIPDDPTARKKLELYDTRMDVIIKMSEGVPGALVAMAQIMSNDENGLLKLFGLDDMNIRGSQIWVAYKYLYHEDANKFINGIRKRDPKMIEFINEELASVGGEKAVEGGASSDRNKMPYKYRFTKEEVEELKARREERLEKQRAARDKMLANSPAKKIKPRQKRVAERKTAREEYRQRLMKKGQKSIGDLDKELTDLQTKEQQARALYEKYEEQLPDKPQQDL